MACFHPMCDGACLADLVIVLLPVIGCCRSRCGFGVSRASEHARLTPGLLWTESHASRDQAFDKASGVAGSGCAVEGRACHMRVVGFTNR